ncbi:tyrosine-type recombinase/integrase [uncultured Christiangramia sp.]|uniref:tyrosine-type recombinase/integrase n=1 Tax=uncultured Christiangramia sp. TaxID=503836 RepID=UPI0025FB50EC|nr:tyrosine-type recombinase/integrase [uncultured Christiangramia sp.]|tara:strand:- start:8165 stop:9496 length:1332 start_codon:yes stop_codon:yes gene_type:complete
MASIKVVLRKNMIRKDETIPLALRISENYKTNYHWLGHYILEKDWDKKFGKVKKSHPNHKKLNHFLMKKMTEAQDLYFHSEDDLTPRQIKNKLKGPGGSQSFFAVAAERVKQKYDKGTFSVAKSELSILYNLEEFLNLKTSQRKEAVIKSIKERRRIRLSKTRKGEYSFEDAITYFKRNTRLEFREINESFLNKYKAFCSTYLGQKTRTITNQLIFIRTLFNVAIKDGIVSQKYYPFAGEKEKIRIGSGNKIGLTAEEVIKIENLAAESHSSIWHTRNIWLVSFYFAGIRISDVVALKWTDIKDGRLYYVMNKNEKPLSFKVPEKAITIFNLYLMDKTENNGYIFPFLKDANQNDPKSVFLKMRNATKVLNKFLKRIAKECEIDKNLSNHIARHTFGNIAGDKIHPLMLQKLYRHSDLKTTLNYQANFIHRDADDALDSVINF